MPKSPRPKSKKKPKHSIPTTRISVVVLDANKILLVKHRKGPREYWVLPGGRLEYGETFAECAVREIKEETGLDVRFEQFLFLSEAIAPDRSRHIVNIYVKAKVIGGVLKVGDEPVLADADFIAIEELHRITVFPPVGSAILDALPGGFKSGMEYLGNLWV